LVVQEQKGLEKVNKEARSMGIKQSRLQHWILLNREGFLLWRGLYKSCSTKDTDDDNDDDFYDESED
jgi:hypothetical protein